MDKMKTLRISTTSKFLLLLLATLDHIPRSHQGSLLCVQALVPQYRFASYYSTFEREFSPSSIPRASTKSSTPKLSSPSSSSSRKNRKRGRRRLRKTKTKNPSSQGDITDHVASQYLNGEGGIFRSSNVKWKRLQDQYENEKEYSAQWKHWEYLKELDKRPSLVLNADYQPLTRLPLSLWSWQNTIKAVFSGKVTVVDVYPEITVHAVNIEVPLPSVIALTEYQNQGNQKPSFTRRNVFLRDGYQCQYCGEYFQTPDLSLDHVVPRSLGGKLEWENAVTCCHKCNSKKGSLRPADLRAIGMKLIRDPRVPTKYELVAVADKMIPKKVHPSWEPFLGFESSVSSDGNAADAVLWNEFD